MLTKVIKIFVKIEKKANHTPFLPFQSSISSLELFAIIS